MSRKPDSEQLDLITSPVEIPPMAMAEFTEKAYLNYSMYVILDRALPSIADGLKPVQRRIIYAMSDLGLHATAKFKKSARTVGDVLGKFHPHGDTACYEAMVLMAQSFSYRYPLIDGQGNWGSQDDPKSFAAMRYTESRLTRYARLLLQELGQGTADWVPNFDGTLTEPKLLPARLPNVLLNGGSGIAVGMATDILPHNLREVADACVQLLDHPKTDLNALLEHIRGPDLPTEAEIVSTRQEMLEIYRTGIGSIRQRATWKMEGSNLILTALPYQVSGGKIQEQIAAQILSKKLPMIADLRDESDHEHPTRLVIEPRSRHIDSDMLMQHLFATTDLERSYRINLNMIDLNGRPRVFDLKSLLEQWLEYRLSTVTRRLEFRHRKVAERLHVLDGLLVAFLNIDEVIRIIRNEDKPKAVLINTYHLSDAQAEAILELKLRQLAKLEEIKIRQEQTELSAERKRLETLLKSPAKLKRLVRDEIMADAEEFGDDRRSPIVKREAAKVLDQHALIPAEPITVILSAQGWIRAAKGHDVEADKLAFKSGDQYLCSTQGKTSDLLLAIDSTGRTYSIPAHALPSARSFGEPLSGSFNPKPGATFCGLMMGQEQSEYLLFTDVGYGFVARLSDLNTRNKAGKAALTVPDNGHVLMPQKVNDFEDDWIAIITNMGRLLIFTVGELVQQAKGKGLKLIALASPKGQSAGEIVVGACVFREKEILRIYSGKRYMHLKPVDFDHYIGSRAQRGRVLPKGFRQPHLIRSIAK